MKYRIKISRKDFEEMKLAAFSSYPKEAGGFLLAGFSETEEYFDVLVRRVVTLRDDDFIAQQEYRLEVSPRAINGLVSLCEASNLGAVVFHSHPETIPYSQTDDFGERRIFEALRMFIGDKLPTASILLYPDGIEARIWISGESLPLPIDEVIIIGEHVERIEFSSDKKIDEAFDPRHSRQVLALGEIGQELIQKTKVAIIGLGGTGSACAEQLARLGVNHFLLVDFDKFEDTNLNRLYGSCESDISKAPYKVDLISEHIKMINSNAQITSSRLHISKSKAASLLKEIDYIFLCTDDHWGRAIVNQVAYQYLIPTINMGIRIDAHEGRIIGAMGNVDILGVDLPCLWCKESINSERIAAESISPEKRKELLREGYIQDIDSKEPSVISLNTVVAGLSVTAFIQLVTNFSGSLESRLNYFIIDGEVRAGKTDIKKDCVCSKFKAFGDVEPLPTN